MNPLEEPDFSLDKSSFPVPQSRGSSGFLSEPILDRLHLIFEMNRFVPPVVDRQMREDPGNAAAKWNLVEHLGRGENRIGIPLDDRSHVG